MSSNQPADPRKVDPFAPKGQIGMDQLPLAALKRYLLGELALEKSNVPVASVPIFGVERGSVASQNRNIGNQTLIVNGAWQTLTTRVRGSLAMSGLRDMFVLVGGTAIVTGAGSSHAVSVTINGIEYTTLVHNQAANTGNGLAFFANTAAAAWTAWGRIPAAKLERKVYEVEIVYRLTGGANAGTMFGDSANLINLYALEM